VHIYIYISMLTYDNSQIQVYIARKFDSIPSINKPSLTYIINRIILPIIYNRSRNRNTVNEYLIFINMEYLVCMAPKFSAFKIQHYVGKDSLRFP
jgi:hypothetical protein